MQRIVWIVCLASCGSPAPEVAAEHAVAGDWLLTASQTAGTCPVEGSVFPVGPGLTTIRVVDGAVELANGGELISYSVRGGSEWRRARNVRLDACEADVRETWVVHNVSGRRFSGSFVVDVEARGECRAYGARSCFVHYGVWGVQP